MTERQPLLLPLVGLMFGILLYHSFPFGIYVNLIIVTSLVALILTLIFANRLLRGHLIFLGFVIAGYSLAHWIDPRLNSNHIIHHHSTEKIFYIATAIESPQLTKRAIRLKIQLNCSEQMAKLTGKAFLYLPMHNQDYKILPGDVVLFDARLYNIKGPKNPYEFNYQSYLHRHGVYVQGYCSEVKIISSNGYSLQRESARFRGILLNHINLMNLTQDEKAIASALLLGYRGMLTEETSKSFSNAGAMHVLAVSGLHVGILYLVVAFFIRLDRKKKHRNNWKKVLITLIIIWLYALLTGLSPSVTRASVMFSFMAVGGLLNRRTSSLQAVIASAFFLLLSNPNYLFEVGFQLSYAAVFGIIQLQPRVYHLIPRIRNRALDYWWQITAVSIAAQAATFPISIYYFHQFPVYFLLTNLMVIPLAFLAMCFGMLSLILYSLFGAIQALFMPLKGILWLMIHGVKHVENLPYSKIDHMWITLTETALYLILVYALADAVWKKRKWALISTTFISILLITLNGIRVYEIKDQHQIIFYSIKNTTAIEYREGMESIVLVNRQGTSKKKVFDYHIQPNLITGGIRNPVFIGLDSTLVMRNLALEAGMVEITGKRILIINEPKDTNLMTLNPDFAVIVAGVSPPHKWPNGKVVLQNGLSHKVRQEWRNTKMEVYDLSTESALQIDLNLD